MIRPLSTSMKQSSFIATKPEQIPNEPHYAIMFFREHAVSDGWGGSNYTPYVEYHVFLDKETWSDAVGIYTRFPERGREKFRAVKVDPATIAVKVSVS